jgi:uncharacterized membrane protein HdeD (DUF308 family)
VRSHRTDTVSLVFGLIFLFLALWVLAGRTLSIGLPTLGWIVAAALITLGTLGLLGALRANRRGDPPED